MTEDQVRRAHALICERNGLLQDIRRIREGDMNVTVRVDGQFQEPDSRVTTDAIASVLHHKQVRVDVINSVLEDLGIMLSMKQVFS